jgi:hypothetical protein
MPNQICGNVSLRAAQRVDGAEILSAATEGNASDGSRNCQTIMRIQQAFARAASDASTAARRPGIGSESAAPMGLVRINLDGLRKEKEGAITRALSPSGLHLCVYGDLLQSFAPPGGRVRPRIASPLRHP